MIEAKPKPKIFYGWWVVVAFVLITMFVGGSISSGFTSFFVPIASTFGWSYAAVSFASSIRGAENGLMAPVIGYLFDRFGARKLVFGGAIVIALGLFILSRTNSLIMFYISFVIIAVGTSTCIGVVPMSTVTRWFRNRVSLASGVVSSGSGLGGLLIPVVTVLIDRYDWRTALVIISISAVVLLIPLSFLIRNKPEDMGTLPDGKPLEAPAIQKNQTSTENRNEPEEQKVMPVLKSHVFWLAISGYSLHVLVTTAMITHIMPYLDTIGLSRTTASLMASIMPLMTIFGRLGFGWMGDKFDIRKLTALGFGVTGIGFLFLVWAGSYSHIFLIGFFILFGLGWGGPVPLQPAFIRHYFPRGRFGTIFGLAMGIAMLTMLIGAPLAGWVYDTYGTYDYIWYGYGALMAVAIIFVMVIPPLKKWNTTTINRL